MTRTAGCILLLLAATVACNRPPETTRVIRLHNMQPDEAALLALPLLGDSGTVSVREAGEPPVIVVTGTEHRVQQVEQMLQQQDRPKPDVVLRFQIIEADGFSESDPTIESVTRVLRDLFRFQGYRLAAEALVRSSAYGEISQVVHGPDGTRYSIKGDVRDIIIAEDGSSSASLDLILWVTENIPALETSVNVPSGQMVVLGTTRPRADRPTLILVVEPEVTTR